MSEDGADSPFSPFSSSPAEAPANTPAEAEEVQPTLWENGGDSKLSKISVVREGDKGKIFGKFIRALRETHKNAVLFTLCMDLEHAFEGDKFILITESETVYKGLQREANAKFIGGVLAELGVNDYEVRLKAKGESDYDKALRELRASFDGADIEEK